MRQNGRILWRVRGLVVLLIVTAFICYGCNVKEQAVKTEGNELYHVSEVDVPEGVNRVQDIQFYGDNILMATDAVKDKGNHIIRLYRGDSSGKEWTQLYEESFAPKEQKDLQDYGISVTLGKETMVIIGRYSFGTSVEDSTSKVAFAKLCDLEGNCIKELKVPEMINTDNVKLEKNGKGIADIIMNPGQSGDVLSQIVELDGNTGESEKIIDNPNGYDYDVVDDVVYIEDHCYNTEEKADAAVPDAIGAMWEDYHQWYEDELNLGDDSRIIWDIVKSRDGGVAGLTLDKTGIYLYKGKGEKIFVGDAPRNLLKTKGYTCTNIYARDAESFYIPFNDETYWGGLKLYHYTKES